MKILVLGAGAIGSVFGGFLAQAGHTVRLIGRKAHVEAIRAGGLFIDGIWGEHLVHGLGCYENLDELTGNEDCTQFDLALLSVKSYDTKKMLRECVRCLKSLPPIVSLQNGLGNVEKIRDIAGCERTIGGRVIFGVEYIKPGHVTVTVSADNTKLGALESGIDTAFVADAAAMLTDAGIPTDAVDDIYRFIYGKVLYNCSLNGLATLLDVEYGRLLGCEETRKIMKSIIQEIFAVARAEGVTLDWQAPGEYEKLLFDTLIPVTFEHHPSMLQDIRRNKPTEIDALNGAIVAMAEKHGIDVPVNRIITQLIKTKESGPGT